MVEETVYVTASNTEILLESLLAIYTLPVVGDVAIAIGPPFLSNHTGLISLRVWVSKTKRTSLNSPNPRWARFLSGKSSMTVLETVVNVIL